METLASVTGLVSEIRKLLPMFDRVAFLYSKLRTSRQKVKEK